MKRYRTICLSYEERTNDDELNQDMVEDSPDLDEHGCLTAAVWQEVLNEVCGKYLNLRNVEVVLLQDHGEITPAPET